jgi:hypothetical protein
LSSSIRPITQVFAPMVALEASLFGAPESPRQNRSSIVIEFVPISFQRRPAAIGCSIFLADDFKRK